MIRVLAALRRVAVVGFAVGVVASFVPVYPCTLLEHFRIHALLAGLVLAALAHRDRWLDLALIGVLLEGIAIAPDLAAAPRVIPAGPGSTSVRLLLYNVHRAATSYEATRALIRDSRADLVGLLEVDDRWLRELAPVLAGYPGRIERTRDDNFGIALYATGTAVGAAEALGTQLPTIVADVTTPGGAQLAVVLTHPLPPIAGALHADQLTQFTAIAARVRGLAGAPVVLAGDFNATPWSHAYQLLRRRSGLCDSRAGFGHQATFPASWPAALGIPIDHVLVACELGVRDRRIGPDAGSDHRPVIVDLVVPSPAAR